MKLLYHFTLATFSLHERGLQNYISVLYSSQMDEEGYQPPFIEGRRRRSPKKRMIISIVVVLLLIVLGIGGFQLFTASTSAPEVTPTPTPTTIVFPTDTPTPTPEATPTAKVSPSPTIKATSSLDKTTGLDRKTLRVIVENGSGKAGAGSGASEALKSLGYTIVSVRNAANFDYTDVTISLTPEKASFLPLLKKDLSTAYTVGTTNTSLSASDSADAVVIIGK